MRRQQEGASAGRGNWPGLLPGCFRPPTKAVPSAGLAKEDTSPFM